MPLPLLDPRSRETCPACHYRHSLDGPGDWQPVRCEGGPLAGLFLNAALDPHTAVAGGEYVLDAGRYVFRPGW